MAARTRSSTGDRMMSVAFKKNWDWPGEIASETDGGSKQSIETTARADVEASIP